MALIVQKYGGTSVADLDRIRVVADRVRRTHAAGHQVAVVVSAMAGETNRLLALAKAGAADPDERETDVIAATGEQVTAALTAIVLRGMGVPARSFLGHQIRIETDRAYGRARIQRIDAERLRATFADGAVAVVAGFQGVDPDGSITTLGRGGSDTSAVALAAALEADVCEIYTDVDGVYTADPRVVKNARKLPEISYDEMLELASSGSKVMQSRSVEFAKKFGVTFEVRSSFNHNPGTIVKEEVAYMEQVVVRGVAADKDQAKVIISNIPDKPGSAAKVFRGLADANVLVDMIVQNMGRHGVANLTFTVPETDTARAVKALDPVLAAIGGGQVTMHQHVAKISVVGVGMKTHSGVAATLFQALAEAGINIDLISTSEIKISVVVDLDRADDAVRVAHAAFGLDKL